MGAAAQVGAQVGLQYQATCMLLLHLVKTVSLMACTCGQLLMLKRHERGYIIMPHGQYCGTHISPVMDGRMLIILAVLLTSVGL